MASYQFKEYNEETETFETFYERLEQFLILEEAGDEKKKAYLLTLMGSKTYGVLKNLCSPILPKNKTFDDLIDILKRHFSPKRSIVVERFIFFKRMQLKEESISDYLVEIKRLASSCNFGNFLEDSLRDKMVCGLYNAKIQNRILSEGDISLAKVIEIALSMEAAEKNTKLFHLEQGEDCVDKLRIERKVESNFQNGKCKHCGKPHKEPCRFKEAICFKCNKKGHIASICWSSRRNLRQHQNQPGNIHQIGDQEEEEEYVQKIISVTIPEYKINFASSDPPYLMELKVEGNFIKFEMDTGSGLTLISEKDFKNSLQHLKLEKASIIVRTYDGTVVPILGKINVKVECQDITYKLRALVVKGEKRALMGREWINRLKLGCFAVKHMPVEITIEEILKENQALFVETTEPIKGFTFSVNMCDVNPIFHKARPVPFAIRPAVTEALDKMVSLTLDAKLGCINDTLVRSTPHVTTGKTPSELFIGRALRTRVSLIHPSLASRVRDQQARQMRYDRRTHLEEFQIDDLVWCKNFRGGDKWIPGKIVGKKGTRVYTILIHGQVKAYHRDQIRKRWRNGEEDESGDGERQPEHSRGAGPSAIISEVVRDRGYMESMSPGLTSQRSDQDSEVQSDTDDGKSLEPLRSLDPEALNEEGPVLRRNPPRARRPPVRFEERRWTETGNKIKRFRTDNGTEFLNKNFSDYLKSLVIVHELTALYTLEQNGISERDNRTIVESARCLLHGRKMPLELWAEAVNTAVYLLNRCTTKVLGNSTPYEIWYKRKPSILHLKTFGCNAYVHIPKDNRKKLDKKSIRTFFVGYTETNKNYRMWDPIARKIIISRDVIFTEAITSENIQDNQQEQITIYSEESVDSTNTSSKPEESCRYPIRNRIREKEQSSTNCTRAISYACYVHDQEPLNYEDAIVGQNSKKWKLAMDDEFNSLMKNQTWTYVTLPSDRKAIACKWVYKIKQIADGSNKMFKARLVAKDVKSAFLNGDLEEELYMEQPQGYENPDFPNHVCSLQKSIYGLKQSPRMWNKKFHEFLIKFDLKPSTSDSCVYTMKCKQAYILLAIYVDDCLICSVNKQHLDYIVQYLNSNFEIKTFTADYFLGLQIYRDRTTKMLFLHQASSIERTLEHYNLLEIKLQSVPSDPYSKLTKEMCPKDNQEIEEMNKIPYRQTIGSLMYLMTGTRPDIAYAVSRVSQFVNNPGPSHWTAVKKIFGYLKATKNIGICFGGSSCTTSLIGFSDADFAGDLDTRKSTTRYVFMLNNGPISWCSQKQNCVSLSTTESEYIAASKATKEAIWLRQLLREQHQEQSNPRMSEGEKVSHLIKGVAEEVYQALVEKDISTVDQFVAFCRRFEAFKRMRVAPPRFNRLPNVTTISTAESENLEALIRRIVREEVQKFMAPPFSFAAQDIDTPPPDLRDVIRIEIQQTLAPISAPRQPESFRTRRQYLLQNDQGYRRRTEGPPNNQRTQWRTEDDKPICFHCGRPGHVVRYCRERQQVFAEARPRNGGEGRNVGFSSRPPRYDADDDYVTPQTSTNELHLEETSVLESREEENQRLFSSDDFVIPPKSIKNISVINEEICGVRDVLVSTSKDLLLRKEVLIPNSLVTFRHGRGSIWVANGASWPQLIPSGMNMCTMESYENGNICSLIESSDKLQETQLKSREWSQKINLTLDPGLSEIQSLVICKFRPYLFGRPFTVVTDHHSLCWLVGQKDPSGRLARWALKLQEFDVTVIYKSGRKHKDDDCLSRSPLENDQPSAVMSLTNVDIEQTKDPDLDKIIDNLNSGYTRKEFSIIDGILYKKNYRTTGRPWLMMIPEHLRSEVMEDLHDAPTAGHLGFARTYDKVKNRFYWPGLYRTVRQYVSHCLECQRRKKLPRSPAGQLVSISPVEKPFYMSGLIFLEDFQFLKMETRLAPGFHRRVKAKTSFQDDDVPKDDDMTTKPLFTPQENGRKGTRDKVPRLRWNPWQKHVKSTSVSTIIAN
ncbi:hypothetical protein LAZ67_8000410, partial [Cordylochernes scorpioides]